VAGELSKAHAMSRERLSPARRTGQVGFDVAFKTTLMLLSQRSKRRLWSAAGWLPLGMKDD
jgi:hypothetical protein